MLLKGRCDKKFNFMGNLLTHRMIKEIIKKNHEEDIDIQIQLSTYEDGRDFLNIVVDDIPSNVESKKNSILNALLSVDEINEGLEKTPA